MDNISQGVYLALHIATAYAVVALNLSVAKTRKAFMVAFYIVVATIAAQAVCELVGVSFPYSLIANNPGYGMTDIEIGGTGGTRNPGTFTEPSLVGAFLVLYCIGFIAQYLDGKGSAARVVIALVASGSVASSSSLFVLAIFTVILVIRYSPFRLPWFFSLRRARRLAWILLLIVVPIAVVLVASPGYRDMLLDLTVSKGESGSFVDRTAADLFALQLLPQTHWLGVGLASNRASSLLTTLASNVGVVGVLAFGMYYFRLFGNLAKEYSWFRWGAFALLFNMCVGVADITIPMLWVTLLLAIHFTAASKPVRPITQDRHLIAIA
jgi:hypothetical protein